MILDVTFQARRHRDAARALAQQLGVRFVIVDFQARADILPQRVAMRARQSDDASEADLAVLEAQLLQAEPLGGDEQGAVFTFDAEPAFDDVAAAMRWTPLLQRLGA